MKTGEVYMGIHTEFSKNSFSFRDSSTGIPVEYNKQTSSNSLNESFIGSNRNRFKIYLIDQDSSQRARLASIIFSTGFHVEIFSSMIEFLSYSSGEGVIFVSDAIHDNGVSSVMDLLNQADVHISVVAYRENPSIEHVISAMRARVTNFLPIEFFETGLREVLEAAEAESNLNQDRRSKLEEVRKRLSGLTKRERQVLDMISDGLSNKEIGRELGISPRTVEIHRMRMLSKMAARSSGEAIKMCCTASMYQ
jgi:RNA polymerase sigma factor (sigma-70 family)